MLIKGKDCCSGLICYVLVGYVLVGYVLRVVPLRVGPVSVFRLHVMSCSVTCWSVIGYVLVCCADPYQVPAFYGLLARPLIVARAALAGTFLKPSK